MCYCLSEPRRYLGYSIIMACCYCISRTREPNDTHDIQEATPINSIVWIGVSYSVTTQLELLLAYVSGWSWGHSHFQSAWHTHASVYGHWHLRWVYIPAQISLALCMASSSLPLLSPFQPPPPWPLLCLSAWSSPLDHEPISYSDFNMIVFKPTSYSYMYMV